MVRCWQHWLAAVGGVLVLLALTRVPLSLKYLYYFDSVNFALAMEEFNPGLHQPQPPGYPLHVFFIRLVHLAISREEHVFLAAGILASAAAVLLLWWLGTTMFSSRAGLAAAVVLLLNPAFWLACLSNQVRLWLAVAGSAVALACWRSVQQPGCWKAFAAACAALGLLSGFRPALLVFLLPLIVYTGWAARLAVRHWMTGLLALAFGVSCWLPYTIGASGGLAAYVQLIRTYSQQEFQTTSLLFGAAAGSAGMMLRAALVWNGYGALSWVWALPVWRRTFPERFGANRLWLLSVWFLPAFLFHAVVHVGDADQTLITIPVLCLIGGVTVAELSRRLTREGWAISLGLVATLNALLFFLPSHGVVAATNYGIVRYVDDTTRQTFEAIDKLRSSGPITLVWHQNFVTWRHLSYYYPDVPLFVLREDYRGAADPAQALLIRNRRTMRAPLADGRIVLPAGKRIVWLLPPGVELSEELGARPKGPVQHMKPASGGEFTFGSYRFTTGT